MSQLDEAFVEHLAKLCRLTCTEEEKKALLVDLNNMLEYVKQLDSCPTEGVEPLTTVIQNQEPLSLREDREEPSLSRETYLRIAPAHIAGLVKVPCIIEE